MMTQSNGERLVLGTLKNKESCRIGARDDRRTLNEINLKMNNQTTAEKIKERTRNMHHFQKRMAQA